MSTRDVFARLANWHSADAQRPRSRPGDHVRPTRRKRATESADVLLSRHDSVLHAARLVTTRGGGRLVRGTQNPVHALTLRRNSVAMLVPLARGEAALPRGHLF